MSLFGSRKRGVDERRRNAAPREAVDLILHQGDQRRDDERDAGQLQRGQLIDQRLARAGGHDHQRVAAAQHGVQRGFLARAKSGEVEVPVQRRVKIDFGHRAIIHRRLQRAC